MDAETAVEGFLARFRSWAEREGDVRGALVVGSRARRVQPADEWSDIDLMIIARRPKRYLTRSGWLSRLGDARLSYVISGPVGDRSVRHVVFEGPVVVDFAFVSSMETRWAGPLLRLLAARPGGLRLLPAGLRVQIASWFEQQRKGDPVVLVDKGGAATRMRIARPPDVVRRLPTVIEFEESVNAFWSLAMWTAKSAERRELWTANWVAGHQLHEELLRMIEWHARAHEGAGYDTWFSGRFIGTWADRRVVAALPRVFARYERDDVWSALSASMELYAWLARETAERCSFTYPAAAEACVTGWLDRWRARTPALPQENSARLP